MKIISICLLLLILTGCQIQVADSDKKSDDNVVNNNQLSTTIEKNINFIIDNEEGSKSIDGKVILTYHKNHCQLDKIFIYPNNISTTYLYTFNNNQLISASTIMPDERNPNKITTTWEDPEYPSIIENFNDVIALFSTDELNQCNIK